MKEVAVWDRADEAIDGKFDARTERVVKLSKALCKVRSVSMPQVETRFDEIQRVKAVAVKFALANGLTVVEMPAIDETPYPYLIVTCDPAGNGVHHTVTTNDCPPVVPNFDVALVGHLDVVPPQNEEDQFDVRVEGDYLLGRGTADMKTVVASQLVWLAEQQAAGKRPSVGVMISFCEENGSVVPNGTKDSLEFLKRQGIEPKFAIVGERTGEMPDKETPVVPPICERGRGWDWFRVGGTEEQFQGKSGFRQLLLVFQLFRSCIADLNSELSTALMEEQANWRTGIVNSFLQVGDSGSIAEGGVALKVMRSGASKHAAERKADAISFAEEVGELLRCAESMFGEDHVELGYVDIGKDGNYNSVTGGGEAVVIVRAEVRSDVADWIEMRPDLTEERGVSVLCEDASAASVRVVEQPCVGVDMRKLPEHSVNIESLIELVRRNVAAWNKEGVELEHVKKGPSWVVDPENPFLPALREAHQHIYDAPSPHPGKVHGSDASDNPRVSVVYGQTGFAPHGREERHYIPSILPALEVMDAFAERMTELG